MSKKQFRPWVLTALAAVAVYVAQLPSIPGVLFMLVGGPFLPGVLIHIALVLLIIDCWSRKTPRALLALPAAYYGLGIALSASSWLSASALERYVASLEVRPIAFDPARNVVVTAEHVGDRDTFLTNLQADYRLGLAFVQAPEEETGYFARFVLPSGECPEDDRNAHIRREPTPNRITGAACVVRIPAAPDRAPVFIRPAETQQWDWEFATFTQIDVESGAERS